jgi:hypothetical protein
VFVDVRIGQIRRAPQNYMTLNSKELEFLSAWAREEKARNPYVLPAHQLQAAHQVRGVVLIRAIKARARAVGREDEDIVDCHDNDQPSWPWSSVDEMLQRLEISVSQARVAHPSEKIG